MKTPTSKPPRFVRLWPLALFVSALAAPAVNTSVHTTWLWHLHQPIYWPDRAPANHAADHYQNAWDTIQLGNVHPSDTTLTTVFGESDRVNAYQGQPSSTVSGLLGYANAGVQLNYSGALMENVQSLAAAGQLGYYNGWNNGNTTAHSWTTSGGKPRMDIVNFTYHHALAPLVSDETLEMELRIHQRQMQIFWGTSGATSRGYFPAETCFSEHMIPILNKVGIAWTVVANNHLARTCPDMPIVTGSGGEMCDLPNAADQINPAQGPGNYQRTAIDRGCSPTQVMPFGFQLHYGRYVNPNTGAESKIILAPADQVFGWKDSYSTWDLGLIAPIAARNNPAKPSLVFCAHDGDNAWSGGSSYYQQWVGQMASTAAGDGYEPTTIEQFISDFPPNTSDVVHVEDGGWVFADGDMGSPMFINWHWPPSYSSNGVNVVDPSLGVSDKADNWRVIIATENRVKTAQQISGITPGIDQVRDPGSFSGTPNAVELGWHYYLGSLDSGFVYYGCHADECLRAIVAQSNACRNVDSILANPANDTTPPTVFIPQRHPWNPGGTNFGVQYGYKTVVEPNSDFWIWTYAYDVSGITNVTLLFRNNGTNPPTSDQFKTYAGGALAGAWVSSNMTQRITPNSSGYTPQYMADYYYSKVTGITNAYVDYYVSATDAHGNTYKSPIQHVWVANGSGANGGGGGSSPVTVSPNPPVNGSSVTIQYVATGRALASAGTVYLHLGWNNYTTIVSPDAAMTFNAASNWWQATVTVPATVTNLNVVFNNGSGTWDNNGGQNWNFTVLTNSTPQAPPTPAGVTGTAAGPTQINLSWPASVGATGYIISRGGSVIASNTATDYFDTGLSSNATYCYAIVATNSVGNSAATASQCVALQPPPTPSGLSVTAVNTNQINLAWTAADTATGYAVSRGGTPLAGTAGTNYSDTGLAPASGYCYTVSATNNVGSSGPTSAQCATTFAAATNFPPFVMDGVLDSTNYLLASSGMTLYAALRGTVLYVATWSPGTNGPNDHFIFVTDQLLPALTNAPWAKTGKVAVAASKPFLAGESIGTYVSWFNAPAGAQAIKAATNAGAMEGTIDLVAAFGYLPTNIYLCSAAYQTADGGALASSCPTNSGADIGTNGFLEIPVIALRDYNGDGIFDRLQPALDFRLQNCAVGSNGFSLNWAAMPGHSYQLSYRDSLAAGTWTDWPGLLTNAGPLQTNLGFTIPLPLTNLQRFYKIKLLP